MILVLTVFLFLAGVLLGFVWGCETTLARPHFARGFLRGFWAPIRTILELTRSETDGGK